MLQFKGTTLETATHHLGELVDQPNPLLIVNLDISASPETSKQYQYLNHIRWRRLQIKESFENFVSGYYENLGEQERSERTK